MRYANLKPREKKMAASKERSRGMQMRCDVVDHVTALDQSEPSTHLIRSSASWWPYHRNTT